VDANERVVAEREMIHQSMLDHEQSNPIPQSVLETSLQPADVVHIRHQMVEWWSEPGVWQRRFAGQGRRPIQDDGGAPSVVDDEAARVWMEGAFRQAELFWVSTEMTQVIKAMYPTIPDCIPEPPCPTGFVVFARSIPGLDAESGGEIYTTAYLWCPVETLIGTCWGIETFAWRDLIHTWRAMDMEERNAFRTAMPLRLHPTGGMEWPMDSQTSDFTKLPASNPQMEASMVEDRRVLATFWALCSQRIALEESWSPDRNIRRRAQREGWKSIPQVRVIRLREPTARTEHEGDSHEVEWSHRWIVGAHWRNQWYPGSGEHRPKLIESYQKGPADKPLVVRETVRALVR
jgi:hypothetical protein